MDALGAVLGVGDLDARRFRMLIELDGAEAHEEDTGSAARSVSAEPILRISAPVPRCAMTTHDPETGLRDYDTLRAIKEYRGQVDGKDLMFGVWGEVERPGSSVSATRSASSPEPRRPRPSRPAALVVAPADRAAGPAATQTTDAEGDQRRDPDRGRHADPQQDAGEVRAIHLTGRRAAEADQDESADHRRGDRRDRGPRPPSPARHSPPSSASRAQPR